MQRDPNWRAHEHAVAGARERFAAGESIERGVRPEILLSWYRCRDEYQIDPRQVHAPPVEHHNTHSLKSDWALVELTAVGTSLLTDVGSLHGILAITDGAGRVLLARGERVARHQAERSNLAPWFTWSERATGTNGMGTALHERSGTLVRRAEHWCEAFHNWSCAGVPISDPTTGQPLAALNVSSWERSLPDDVLPWLRQSVKGIEEELRQHAAREATNLRSALEKAGRNTVRPLIALDNGGAVIAANDKAESFIGDSVTRITADCPELTDFVRQGVARAQLEHTWVGTAEIFHPPTNDMMPVTFQPVLSANCHVIGLLATFGVSEGEMLDVEPPSVRPQIRVSATHGSRLILLSPTQIKFATAKGNTVWLATDGGLLRARGRGLERLERELHPAGFVRAHRNFLVNLDRVHEVNYGFRGQMELVMDATGNSSIPVSKRRAASIRRALKL